MFPHDRADRQSESVVADAVTAMKLDPSKDTPPAGDQILSTTNGGGSAFPDDSDGDVSPAQHTDQRNNGPLSPGKSRSASRSSPVKKEEDEEDEEVKDERDSDDRVDGDGDDEGEEEKVGGDITVKLEPGQPPKLTRSSSQKVVPRPPQLFTDLPDSTAEAKSTFGMMEMCTYANKYMGYTEHAMECDCAEEWGKWFLQPNNATSPFSVRIIAFICQVVRVPHLSLVPLYIPKLPRILSKFAKYMGQQTLIQRRTLCWEKSRMRRGFRLYQPRNQNRVHGRLRMRARMPKSTVPASGIRSSGSDQDREEGLRAACRSRSAITPVYLRVRGRGHQRGPIPTANETVR